MKVATVLLEGKPRVGEVDEASGSIRLFEPAIGDMVELLERSIDPALPLLDRGPAIELTRVQLVAPLVPRRNIFCVGKNYRAHAKEFAGSGFEAGAVKGAEIDEFPAVFSKPPSTVVGHLATVSLHPQATQAVDYEAELAIVIGKGGRDISAQDAMDHIWGCTIVNDVTARDRQKNHKQWLLGKALDSFCPMGPWITTIDELNIGQLDVQCKVNGELRQNANTRDLIFDIPSLVATISSGLRLSPGDVIATGTPAGVGIGFSPPRFLQAGDEVSISIAGIGTLTNRFA